MEKYFHNFMLGKAGNEKGIEIKKASCPALNVFTTE